METRPSKTSEPPVGPLHVGVVAYEMEGRPSGVGRYLGGLLRGLQTESPPGWRWTLFFRGDPFASDLFSPDESAPIRGVFDGRPNSSPIAWEQFRLPFLLRRHDLGFLFSPAYSLPPFAGLPRMLTLHDLSFENLPEEFGWRERWRRRVLARLAAARASRVLTDTAAVARELQSKYRVAAERIGIVPLAVEAEFCADPESDSLPQVLTDLGLGKPYLLHLGSVLPRRRIDLTLDAFARLAAEDRDLQLVIAGADRLPDDGELERRIEESGVRERIVRLPWVAEEALMALYQHAAASIYISTYEGYGLPPLESLAAGTPAVVSSGLALDDLWPDYSFRVELNRESLLTGLRDAIGARTEDFGKTARSILGQLDWSTSARCLVEEIRIARSAS